MLADRFALRRQWQRIQDSQSQGNSTDQDQQQRFDQRLEASRQRLEQRRRMQPRLDCPDELPIAAHREKIVELLRTRQVIVVCGETGSGKSTQLPKFCLEAGLGRAALIGHTQPRRLAARSIAGRLSDEMACPGAVGFKIRFVDETADTTLVKLMTDGVLLAETQSDRYLERYDAIIIDEAHERSLNIDFLLGLLRRLQGKRPDLRIIITSATIDAERFAAHFADEDGPAPIVNVEGRGYPVELRYLPWEDVVEGGRDDDADSRSVVRRDSDHYDLARHVVAGVEEVMQAGPGDALVFLPTERDIREVSHRLSGHFKRQGRGNVELLPLYARLPQKEQQRIFNPQGNTRRIVLATNVAESSLTVPRIHYVVDAGTARISRYSSRSKVQRLPIEAISQASANQRAGRCGRIGPGVCVRLYSEEDFASRPAFTTPEIRRTNLASVILQTKTLRLGAIDEFPFLDPPRPESVREGLKTLHEIGALDDDQRLTTIGRQLGRMPVDPRVGRMLLAAEENGVLPEVLVIAAAIEVQDPRERPPDKQQAADEAHEIFRDADSDFIGYLRIWDFYHRQQKELSRSRLQKACRSRFLSPMRMREWTDVYRQLRSLVGELPAGGKRTGGKRMGGRSAGRSRGRARIEPPRLLPSQAADEDLVPQDRYDAIHRSLLTGLLSGVAMLTDKNRYAGAGGLQLSLWPGSGVFAKPPKWIVAAELVETSRTYARTVARIQPQWLEDLAEHLVRRSYSDPHWSKKQGGAFCYERVNLFGLPIVLRRRVPLAPVDPTTARELLIEQGLVERQLPTRAKFVTHNRRLRDLIEALAAKSRQRQFVVDPLTILHFYHARLPVEVVDRTSLERLDRQWDVPDWSKQLRQAEDLDRWLDEPPAIEANESELYMHPGDLLPEAAGGIQSQQFPDVLDVGGSQLPVDYHYEPGSPRDGLSVTVPKAALTQVSDHRLGWLVPGLLEAKLVAMIKSLPKRIRRNLVPAADVARAVCDELAADYGRVPFMPAVCQSLSRRAEMEIRPEDFSEDKLPEHFQMRVNVVDDQGQTLASGRSVSGVMQELGIQDSAAGEAAGGKPVATASEREGMTTFDLERIEAEVVTERGGVRVAQYPALVDDGDSVSLRLFADAATAAWVHEGGLTRLFAITERKELRSQVRWLPGGDQARMLLARVLPADQFEASLMDLIARIAFVDDQSPVRTREEFEQRRQQRGQRIAVATQSVAKWLPAWADAFQQARSGWESLGGSRHGWVREDIDHQVQWLTRSGFLTVTPWRWLQHYPRYFEAIAYRIDKLRSGGEARDRDATDQLWRLATRLDEQREGQADGQRSAAIQTLDWMLQELRVSLFAQPLGTAEKVSVPRIEKLMAKL